MNRRVKRTARSSSAARPLGRAPIRRSRASARGGGGVVAAGADCADGALGRDVAARRAAARGPAEMPRRSRRRRVRPTCRPCRRTRRRPASSGSRSPSVISGQDRSPPMQHSTKLRIGCVERLIRSDQAFAQQQLDVAVIAGALEDLALAQQIDAAVADVRPARAPSCTRHTAQVARGRCSSGRLRAELRRLPRARGPASGAGNRADRTAAAACARTLRAAPSCAVSAARAPSA